MPNVPPELKERLKREVSIQRLAEARGIKLHRAGKELIGLCPFHKDTHPSLNIDPAKNVWHCKGACNEGGDVLLWVMRAEGVSFTHAVELLKRDYLPSAVSPEQPPPKLSTVPKLPPLFEATADDNKLLHRVVEFYHTKLKESPEAQQYLAKRGLLNAEMFERFRLGYSDRSLGYLVPQKNRKLGADLRGRLEKLGIFRETSGHEHFRGSIVIPIIDAESRVRQMYGRKITPNLRAGTPDHLYLPGPHNGVWNEAALIASKEIILCEALIDALSFWSAGFRNVTTSYGVNGFTGQIKAAFEKHGTRRIYIAYDRDEAGDRAAVQHAEELMAMGIECFRVLFPKGMDANEYALKVTPAPKSLGVMLNKAEWLGKGTRPSMAVIEPMSATLSVEKLPAPPAVKAMPTPAPFPIPAETFEPSAVPTPTAATEEESEAAAKGKISEPVFSLAADVAVPHHSEAAVQSVTPTAAPAVSVIDVPAEINGDEITITQGDRRYRIRGLAKNMSYELLRVNIFVSGSNLHGEFGYHGDTLDLNLARQRAVFIKQTAEELGVKEEIIHRDLGRVWLKLEELRDQQIKQALQPGEEAIEMTAEEKAAALELLRDPHLLERIVADFERCGVVGEETNKLVGYVAAVSRHLESPLAVIVQSSSAAGKSSLMEAVLAFLPEEQRVQYSAMTGQSLFYMGETDLKNKVLAIVEEEGAQRAAYALKLLQSEGVLTIASTGKDATTGRLITHQYRVEGPVMIFLTTTAIDLDEELLNRCLVLTVNEDREQTQAIHRKQREAQTLEGLLAKHEREELLKLHRNAQRLLKPIFVANPYARELTFLDSQTRSRRDHMKYLTLIRSLALLHQHQRPRKTTSYRGKPVEYIEVTLDDIAMANQLAHEVLGRSLDELPPQTRRLLLLIDDMVSRICEEQKIERSEYRFSRREVRQYTGWGDTQLRVHLHRLEELEYLLVHRGGRGQSFVYELLFERKTETGKPQLPGLIEVERLRACNYDRKNAGSTSQFAGATRGQNGGIAGSARGEETLVAAQTASGFYENLETITSGEQLENHIVAVPPTRSNGAHGLAAGVHE